MNKDIQNENYDLNFSEFYELYLTSHAKRAYQKINELLKTEKIYNTKDMNIIDFMCGTGTLLSYFEKEHLTEGVDISTSMLNIAKRNLNSTKFTEADVTNYYSETKYTVALSTADAVNHLPNISSVNKLFKNINKSLKKDGIFIFDMNTRLGVNRNAFFISSSDENGLSIREGFVDDINNIGYTRFQGFFRKNNYDNYKRFDSIIYNHIYEIDDIEILLKQNGFIDIKIYDFDNGGSFNSDYTERILVSAKKQ